MAAPQTPFESALLDLSDAADVLAYATRAATGAIDLARAVKTQDRETFETDVTHAVSEIAAQIEVKSEAFSEAFRALRASVEPLPLRQQTDSID